MTASASSGLLRERWFPRSPRRPVRSQIPRSELGSDTTCSLRSDLASVILLPEERLASGTACTLRSDLASGTTRSLRSDLASGTTRSLRSEPASVTKGLGGPGCEDPS